MLKRLASDFTEVYTSFRPILVALRELAKDDSTDAMIDTLRERILGDDIDRVTLVQIGIGPSGEAITETISVSDYRGIALDDAVPAAIREQIGDQPLILSNKDGTATKEVSAYMRDTIQASNLSILPLIGRNHRITGYLTIATNQKETASETEAQTLGLFAAQIAIVMDGLSLRNALSRKSEALDLIVEVSREMAGTLTLDALGTRIADGLSTSAAITHLSISLSQGDALSAQTETFHGEAFPEHLELKGTLLETAVREGRSLVMTGAFDSVDAALWKKAGADTVIVAPLQIQNRILGTLNVGFGKADGRVPLDPAIYEQLAGQIAIALEHSHMVEQFQQSLEETTTIYSTALALNASQTPEEAYETMISELALLSGADRIRFYLAGPDPHGDVEYLEEASVWENGELQLLDSRQQFGIEEAPILGKFAFSRANLIFSDVDGEPRLPEETRENLRNQGIRSVMLIPVSTGSTWMGAAILEARSEKAFNSEQVRKCRNVADQAALVIGTQILLMRAQEATARERALLNASATLSGTLNPEALLSSALESLYALIPHDAAKILVIEDGQVKPIRVRGYAAQGIDEEKVMALRIPVDAANNLRTMRDQKKPVIISNTEQYEDWLQTPETSWVKSYAGAPIFVGDNLIGFISLDSAKPGFFTLDNANLLQTFADQFGLAYQNAQTFQTSRLRMQREQILGDVSGKLQAVSTMDDVMETAARSIQAILGEYDVSLYLNPADAAEDREFLPNAAEEGRE